MWVDGQLQLDTAKVQGYSSPNGSFTPAHKVVSECTHDSCLCTSQQIKDIQFELKYARLTLLGYFPIHQDGPNGEVCSQIRSREGFEPLMAFKYAIQRVNNDPNLLPNVTLGYMVFDTCSDDEYAGLTFDAFDKNLRFFSKPPQLPVMTYVHAFIGGFENDVSKALSRVSDTGQRLVQVSYYSLKQISTTAFCGSFRWKHLSLKHGGVFFPPINDVGESNHVAKRIICHYVF